MNTYCVGRVISDCAFTFRISVVYRKLRHLKFTAMRISNKNYGFTVIVTRRVYLVFLKRCRRNKNVPTLSGHCRCFKMNCGRVAFLLECGQHLFLNCRICKGTNITEFIFSTSIVDIELSLGQRYRLLRQHLRC